MSYLDDPRVYFAAERTLLAWVRTGAAFMGMGFMVARFTMFTDLMMHGDAVSAAHRHSGTILGIGFVAAGALSCLIAAIQFKRFVTTLSERERPPHHSLSFPVVTSSAFAVAGKLLAVYLLL